MTFSGILLGNLYYLPYLEWFCLHLGLKVFKYWLVFISMTTMYVYFLYICSMFVESECFPAKQENCEIDQANNEKIMSSLPIPPPSFLNWDLGWWWWEILWIWGVAQYLVLHMQPIEYQLLIDNMLVEFVELCFLCDWDKQLKLNLAELIVF